MRDVKRIPKVLKALEEKWLEYPDMRFGQLLINMGIATDEINLWAVEDDKMLEHIKRQGF